MFDTLRFFLYLLIATVYRWKSKLQDIMGIRHSNPDVPSEPIENVNDKLEATETLIAVSDELINVLTQTIRQMTEMFKNSDTQGNHVMIAKSTAAGVSIAGSVIGITAASIALAPFTLGASLVTGIFVASVVCGLAGAATSIGSSIADRKIREKYDQQKSENMSTYKELRLLFEQLLNSNASVVHEVLNMRATTETLNYIKNWLNNGFHYDDEQIFIDQLRPGDHIMRPIRGLQIKHHGVFLGGNNVIEHGADNLNKLTAKIRIVSLRKFMDGTVELHRRNYKGFAVSFETTKMLENRCMANYKEYNFFQNNCEHFATWLKIQRKDSYQCNEFLTGLTEAVKQIPRASKVIVETVDASLLALKAVAPFGELAENDGNVIPSAQNVLRGASAAKGLAVALIPVNIITAGVDIYCLVDDIQNNNKRKSENKEVLKALEDELSNIQSINKCLASVKININMKLESRKTKILSDKETKLNSILPKRLLRKFADLQLWRNSFFLNEENYY